MVVMIGVVENDEELKECQRCNMVDLIDPDTAQEILGYDYYGQWLKDGIKGKQVVGVLLHNRHSLVDALNFIP